MIKNSFERDQQMMIDWWWDQFFAFATFPVHADTLQPSVRKRQLKLLSIGTEPLDYFLSLLSSQTSEREHFLVTPEKLEGHLMSQLMWKHLRYHFYVDRLILRPGFYDDECRMDGEIGFDADSAEWFDENPDGSDGPWNEASNWADSTEPIPEGVIYEKKFDVGFDHGIPAKALIHFRAYERSTELLTWTFQDAELSPELRKLRHDRFYRAVAALRKIGEKEGVEVIELKSEEVIFNLKDGL